MSLHSADASHIKGITPRCALHNAVEILRQQVTCGNQGCGGFADLF